MHVRILKNCPWYEDSTIRSLSMAPGFKNTVLVHGTRIQQYVLVHGTQIQQYGPCPCHPDSTIRSFSMSPGFNNTVLVHVTRIQQYGHCLCMALGFNSTITVHALHADSTVRTLSANAFQIIKYKRQLR